MSANWSKRDSLLYHNESVFSSIGIPLATFTTLRAPGCCLLYAKSICFFSGIPRRCFFPLSEGWNSLERSSSSIYQML